MKKVLFFLLVLCTVGSLSAQRNFSLYNFGTLPQNHYFNAATGSSYKVSVSLPLGIQSFGFSNSGFRLNDILVKRADDSLVVSPANAFDRLRKLNYLEFGTQIEVFGLGLKIRNQYFSFSTLFRGYAGFIYPKDFYVFLLEGNGNSLLGKRADMDGLGFNLNAYMEYALGYNRNITDRLKVGARVKLLSGIANATTKKSKLGLTTDAEDYSITLDGELDFRTAGIFAQSNSQSDPLQNAINFKNAGFAVDLGATYELTDKLSLNAALNDVGSIKWTTDVSNYKKENVSYTFNGVDLNTAFRDSNYFENLTDTLAEIFKLEEDNNAYTKTLPIRMIVGGQYKLTNFFTAYSTLFSDFIGKKYRPTILLGSSFAIRNWFMVSANYMATTNSFGNIGTSIMLRGAGIQFFVSTDNIFGAMNFGNNKNFHASIGLGLTFGRPRKKD